MAAGALYRGGCDNKRRLARAALAAALLCGFCWGMPVHSLATEPWQYVAFVDDDNNGKPESDETWTMTVGDKTYTYYRATVDGQKFWVREGYHIAIDHQDRYTGQEGYPSTDKIIRVYRNLGDDAQNYPGGKWTEGSQDGLLSTTAVVNWDMGSKYVTSNGECLQNVAVNLYAGASMAGTAVPDEYSYVIYNGKDWIDVGAGNFDSYFKPVIKTDQGYMYNGKLVSSSNVYVIQTDEGDKIGVFTTDGETLYTGTVYGKNNEILLTGIDANGAYHSYWGGERNDPDAEMGTGGLALGQLNEDLLGTVLNNDRILYRADIKDLTVESKGEGQGGTIGLVNNEGKEVGKGVTVTSTGGTGGSGAEHDMQIQFSTDEDHKFTVNAGSKVEAVGSQDNLTGLIINGSEYTIANGGGGSGADKPVIGSENITVDSEGDNYHVSLNNDLTLRDKNGTEQISIKGSEGTISATDNISGGSFSTENITIDEVKDGKHTGTINGLQNKTWDGENYVSGQAATEDQLHAATAGLSEQITNNTQNISYLQNSVNKLDNRIDRVGAGAAALAALHPQDFDPDAKWDFAAGYGNYRGASATAIGAFYRPNEDVMISVGGAFGGGENMVNAGLSFKIGRGASNVTNSRTAMAKEIKDLREAVAKQDAQIRQLTALVQTLAGMKTDAAAATDFPDVPENHWAYEAVNDLARRGLVEGYPDGTFGGDRTLTRYEFAQIVYNALQKGAAVDDRLVDEFRPELTYFRIDTVKTDDAGRPVIQRVRANRV